MPQRNVSLSEPQDRFIENSVATGRFRTADEAVDEALQLLEEKEHEDADKLQWLKAAADAAWATFDRGEYVTLSSDEEIRNYVREVSKHALDEHGAGIRG